MNSIITKIARQLRHNSTDCERILWCQLRSRQFFQKKFRRQQPIGPYVVDFYCSHCRLVIELDGGQHADQVDADQRRTEFLIGQGYQVLRFWNNQVLENIEGVLKEIWKALNHPHPNPLPNKGEGEGSA